MISTGSSGFDQSLPTSVRCYKDDAEPHVRMNGASSLRQFSSYKGQHGDQDENKIRRVTESYHTKNLRL